MQYPIRHQTHKIESKSWTILRNQAPDNWVVREVTERDYGIDSYIEIENRDGQITGEIFSGQLKGTEQISWKDDQTAVFSGIAQSTINYWMGLPMPVFLFVADLSESEVYFCAVRQQVRRNYGAFLKQKSFGFELCRVGLSSKEGNISFVAQYFREKFFERFRDYAREIIMRWQEHWDFIHYNQNRDCFLEVEEEKQLQLVHLYKCLQFLANLHGLKWNVEDLNEAFDKDMKDWNCDYYTFHEQTMDRLLQQLEPIFIEVLEKTVLLIANDEGDFWFIKERLLFTLAINLPSVGHELRNRNH